MRWCFTKFAASPPWRLQGEGFGGGTEFRNCAPGRWGLGLQLLGRMGEWSWLAAAGPARVGGVPGPAGLSRPVYGAARGPSALPSAITLTFASRSGSSSGAFVPGCSLGSLAFEPCPSSAFVRRGPPGGKTYAYPEGHPRWLPASKRVNPFWIRASKAAVLRFGFVSRGRPLVPFRLVKSGRDHNWDACFW